MKNSVLSIFMLAIVSCSSVEIKSSQSDVDAYFNNQDLTPKVDAYRHPKHGEVSLDDPRYTTDYENCLNESFEGKSYQFGSTTVSEPKKLMRYNLDKSIHAIKIITGRYEKGFKANAFFLDKQYSDIDKEISDSFSKSVACVKKKGWEEVRKNDQ